MKVLRQDKTTARDIKNIDKGEVFVYGERTYIASETDWGKSKVYAFSLFDYTITEFDFGIQVIHKPEAYLNLEGKKIMWF